jgi:hypothetical protein
MIAAAELKYLLCKCNLVRITCRLRYRKRSYEVRWRVLLGLRVGSASEGGSLRKTAFPARAVCVWLGRHFCLPKNVRKGGNFSDRKMPEKQMRAAATAKYSNERAFH